MSERCDYSPVLKRAGRTDLNCSPVRAASYRNMGLCERCPRVTQSRQVESDFRSPSEKMGYSAARGIVFDGIDNSSWGRAQNR